jgi:cytochrome P450
MVETRGFIEDPYKVYRALLEQAPIWRTPHGKYVVSGYDDSRELLLDHRAFGQPQSRPYRSFVVMEPPEHTRLRRLVAHAFMPRSIAQLSDRLVVLADRLLAEIQPLGEADLMTAFAGPLPRLMIAEMLGLPLDEADVWTRWGAAIHRGTASASFLPEQDAPTEQRRAEGVAAAQKAAEYVRELVRSRRGEQRGVDIISTLLTAEEDGQRLTEDDLVWTILLLLQAGHHTSVNLIGNALLALLRTPAQLELLRQDRDLVPNAVEEALRYDPSVQVTERWALTDVEFRGTRLEAGTSVLIAIAGANRDPSVFTDPDEFDVLRPNANAHLAFAWGIHHCLGHALARAEGIVAINAVLDRLPDLRLTELEPPHQAAFPLRRRLERLPVAWTI